MHVQPKKLLIVDDHPVIREGLRAIIKSKAGNYFDIVGETGSAQEAFLLVEKFRPHLALIDITLSGPENGIHLTRRITRTFPSVLILVMSAHDRMDYVCESLRAGADGYLTKESATGELLNAIKSVMRGGAYLDPNLSPDIVRALKKSTETVEYFPDTSLALLSSREQQVFHLLAHGKKAGEIGNQLNLSPKTVENHKTSIFRKLNFNRYYDLYKYATRIGIIDPDY